ncbi:MAG: cysteine-rich CWC family protein [Pseudomonas profundi]|uniref:cysteine-rich CWC family protein n=2 Tax=Pseudomonas profundi TaxID=1981513 RepID=UPI00123AA368
MNMTPTSTSLCPLCAGANQCTSAAASDTGGPCWCFNVPISKEALAQVPGEQANKVCLCAQCAAGLYLDDETAGAPPV